MAMVTITAVDDDDTVLASAYKMAESSPNDDNEVQLKEKERFFMFMRVLMK